MEERIPHVWGRVTFIHFKKTIAGVKVQVDIQKYCKPEGHLTFECTHDMHRILPVAVPMDNSHLESERWPCHFGMYMAHH